MKYNVLFKGETAEGTSCDTVKQNIGKAFKLDSTKVNMFFAGKPVILKKNIDYDTAMKVRTKFERTGAKCNVIPINDKVAEQLNQNYAPDKETVDKETNFEQTKVACIKCGHEQLSARECSKCGIVFDKFKENEEVSKVYEKAANEKTSDDDEFDDDYNEAENDQSSDLTVIKLALLIGGIVLCYFGYNGYKIKTTKTGGPIPMSMEAIDDGMVVVNSYISIDEHVKLYPASVYSYDKNIFSFTDSHTPDTKINYNVYPIVSDYHPLIPDVRLFKEKAETVGILPTESVSNGEVFQILVKADNITTAKDVPFVIEHSDSIVGLVRDKFKSLDPEVKNLVKVSFPLLDTKNLIVLDENKKPLSKPISMGFMGGGIFLILGSIVWIIKGGS